MSTRPGIPASYDTDISREPAAAPDFYTVTVTVKMTDAQRAEYRAEYGGMPDQSVADDIAGRLQGDVTQALHSCYWLREFTSYSVSKPR
jgi:hypothetical protein